MTFTSLRDLGNIVAKAIDYDGAWPAIGGIRGNTVTDVELVAIGARVRGECFAPSPLLSQPRREKSVSEERSHLLNLDALIDQANRSRSPP